MDKQEQYQEELTKILEGYTKKIFNENDNPNIRMYEFVEKSMYLAAMRHCLGNQTKAKDIVGVSQNKLGYKLDRYFNTRKVGYKFADVE